MTCDKTEEPSPTPTPSINPSTRGLSLSLPGRASEDWTRDGGSTRRAKGAGDAGLSGNILPPTLAPPAGGGGRDMGTPPAGTDKAVAAPSSPSSGAAFNVGGCKSVVVQGHVCV